MYNKIISASFFYMLFEWQLWNSFMLFVSCLVVENMLSHSSSCLKGKQCGLCDIFLFTICLLASGRTPVSSPLAPLTPSPVWAVGGFTFFFLKDRLASWDAYLHPQKDKPSQIDIPAAVFFYPSCKIPSFSSYHGSQPHVFRKSFSSSFVLINHTSGFFFLPTCFETSTLPV